MKRLVRSLDELSEDCRHGAVTVGNFDGVHQGHRHLIGQLVQLAKLVNGPAVVMTFDPPPSAILYPESHPPALTWMQRRAEMLFELGVDIVFAYPTDLDLLRLEAEEFFEQILVGHLAGRAFAEGPNFHFGRNRRGNLRLLEQLCHQRLLPFSVVLGESAQGEMISSSRIRRLISEGEISEANQLLVAPYRLRGIVGRGAGRGGNLGFPTANLEQIEVLVPAHGVYSGQAKIGDNLRAAAVHIGPNPTFTENISKVEVHVLDLEQDLYNLTLEVEIHSRLRDVKKFASIGDLVDQLAIDIQMTRQLHAKWMRQSTDIEVPDSRNQLD